MCNSRIYTILILIIFIYGCSDSTNKSSSPHSDLMKNVVEGLETQKKWKEYEKDYTYLECTPTNRVTDKSNWNINYRLLKYDSMVNPFKSDVLSSPKKEDQKITLTPYQKGFLASKKGKERKELEKEFLKQNKIEAEKKAKNSKNTQEEEKTVPTLFIDWHWGLNIVDLYILRQYKQPQSCQAGYDKNDTKLEGWCNHSSSMRGKAYEYIPARNNFLDSYVIDSNSSDSTYTKLVDLWDSVIRSDGYTYHPFDQYKAIPEDRRLNMKFGGSPAPMRFPLIDRKNLSVNFVLQGFDFKGACKKMSAEEYISSVNDKYKDLENFLNQIKNDIIKKQELEKKAKEEREEEFII